LFNFKIICWFEKITHIDPKSPECGWKLESTSTCSVAIEAFRESSNCDKLRHVETTWTTSVRDDFPISMLSSSLKVLPCLIAGSPIVSVAEILF